MPSECVTVDVGAASVKERNERALEKVLLKNEVLRVGGELYVSVRKIYAVRCRERISKLFKQLVRDNSAK